MDYMDYRESHQHRGADYDATIAADAFDSYIDRWEQRHVREIVPRTFPAKIPRYLDFACGTGRLTTVIAPLATEVVGVDVSESMLAKAAAKLPSARFLRADLTTEKHDLGMFDLVSSFRFFGNAQAELRAGALRALNALLRPGGYLLLNNHRNPNAIASLIARVRGRDGRATPAGGTAEGASNTLANGELRRILTMAGFSVVEAHPIAVWQYRARLMVTAGRNLDREARLERMFGSSLWLPLAPDAVLLAQKVGDAQRA